MEKPLLPTFVTWQKGVLLAAQLFRQPWPADHRRQGEDLQRESLHLACVLAAAHEAVPSEPADWDLALSGCAELYTRVKVAELSGALGEREARGLLAQCEELDRHLQGVRRAAQRPPLRDHGRAPGTSHVPRRGNRG
jgi:hypothetical protein